MKTQDTIKVKGDAIKIYRVYKDGKKEKVYDSSNNLKSGRKYKWDMK